jgi:hypothetical protein
MCWDLAGFLSQTARRAGLEDSLVVAGCYSTQLRPESNKRVTFRFAVKSDYN